MITLTDILKLSIREIQQSLFSPGKEVSWSLCRDLSESVSETAVKLEQEYSDFSRVIRISLASYFISFLVLFFQKQGPVKADDLLKIEHLKEMLEYLGSILMDSDAHYKDLDSGQASSTADFLHLWLSGASPFSGALARENIILDLLIRFDLLHATKLSRRLLNDIYYIVYSLAMHDNSVTQGEQKLLDFLHQETAKVQEVIGDESDFDVESYTETLNSKNAAILLREAREELEELIGLDGIKNEFAKLEAFLKIQQRREELELPVTGLTLHFVFRGNPGTGKTTVARILGKLFRGVGFLEKGHVEETDRSGLVAEYLGQTALKTKARAEQALDGILFIDEAYALSRSRDGGNGNDAYGREAIETILKFMEDNRKRVVVVVAGYPEPMDEFMSTNPGLKSRFTRYLDFADFQPLQLCQILQLFANKGQYRFTNEAISALAALFSAAFEQRTSEFGNARFVRNLFEQILQNQAMRLAAKEQQLCKEDLSTLFPVDIPQSFESFSCDLTALNTPLPWCQACDRRQPQCPAKLKTNTD